MPFSPFSQFSKQGNKGYTSKPPCLVWSSDRNVSFQIGQLKWIVIWRLIHRNEKTVVKLKLIKNLI